MPLPIESFVKSVEFKGGSPQEVLEAALGYLKSQPTRGGRQSPVDHITYTWDVVDGGIRECYLTIFFTS
jgi:hypothetical protein